MHFILNLGASFEVQPTATGDWLLPSYATLLNRAYSNASTSGRCAARVRRVDQLVQASTHNK